MLALQSCGILPPYRPPSYNEADLSDKPFSISEKELFTEEESAQIDSIRLRQIQTLVSLDGSIAEIMQALEESGELDNTVIIFISDNGKHWGEHRMGSKSSAYEESIKVPFSIRYPPLIPSAYAEDKVVANIDIAPTLYELSKMPIPKTVDGMSLIPLLKGKSEWRKILMLEAWPDRGTWTAAHSGQYVYIETENDLSEFYDLEVDPYEMDNMINDPKYASIILELKTFLKLEKNR